MYCVVPAGLAARLHEPLRRHFRGDAGVRVVVESRLAERRTGGDRRRADRLHQTAADRRTIRSDEGRRISERRMQSIVVAALPLPRLLRRYADRLVFIERLEPSSRQAEDVDTARLVTLIQAGEQERFAELYTRYFDRVYSYLRVLLRDGHEAEDLTQQVFIKVLEALPRYERRSQPFRAWLFTIVKNHAITHLRRQRPVDVADPAELSSQRDRSLAGGDDPPALDWIDDHELLLFIERLPLAQRQVLVLRYMLDLTDVQIGEILGRSRDDVRGLQYRALTFLRARLAAIGRVPPDRKRVRMRSCPNQAFVLRSRRFALVR